MKEEQILTFIKAIDKHFFNSFINNGQVCLNTIKWFRNYEKQDSNIGDKFEGVNMAFGRGFSLKVARKNKSKKTLNKQDSAIWFELGKGNDFRFYHEVNNANVFSLFAINSEVLHDQSEKLILPQKFIDEFSNHRFVIFLEPIEFVSKMHNAISKLGKKMHCGLVKYYNLDSNLNRNLSYFHKPDIYSYQNEFRIIFEDEDAVQQIFNIGSLSKICLEIDIKKKYIFESMKNNQFSFKSID